MKINWMVAVCFALATATSCSDNEVVHQEPLAVIEDELTAGDYIVVFRNESVKKLAIDTDLSVKQNAIAEQAHEIFAKAQVHADQFDYVYVNALSGVSLSLSTEEATRLSKSPDISHLLKVRQMSVPRPVEVSPEDMEGLEDITPVDENQLRMAQAMPWGVARVGGPRDGTGKTAWILDTGIDLDHPDLNVDVARAVSFIDGESADDGYGHGTHVAGTVAAIDNDFGVVGTAAGATVVPVKVLSNQGFGSDAAVIGGIDYALQYHSPGDVANMSLGGSASIILDEAVLNAAEQGLRFCIAAGNGNLLGIAVNASTVSPARVNHPNVLTISAMNPIHGQTIFSNFSSTIIDYAAPGIFINSTYKNGGYRSFAGTSQATPHVTGIWLLGDIDPKWRLLYDWDGNKDWIAHQQQ